MKISLQNFQQKNEFEWELSRNFRKDMRVPIRIFATRTILEDSMDDLSIDQAINASTLPGLIGSVMVMPDVHQGYGFPIGGVAAMTLEDGVISPGAIGYDINCGVRLLASSIQYCEVVKLIDSLATAIDELCPSGVGAKGTFSLTDKELDDVCRSGAGWALKKGFALKDDLRLTEENGCLNGAAPGNVSQRAKERGRTQLGTLGAGNHFIEVDVVDEIQDARAAQTMGLSKGCLMVQIHCGSRGFGHQICTDYVHDFQPIIGRYNIAIPDRELVCAPIKSQEGQDYLGAMRAAANYAFANRQILATDIRQAFEKVFAGKLKDWHLHQVYDITHNMAKIETHNINGQKIKVCVHRKGATRAFGPDAPGLPAEYKLIGQPVLVPGSMGSASWVLVGTQLSMERSFGSACHGAGRLLSRTQAKKEINGGRLKLELENQGIRIRAGSLPGLAEESPRAYKDVDAVVDTVVGAGIACKVARLRPVAVIKG